jgi:hypothetical protein
MSLRRKEVADYYKNRAELSSEEAQFLFCRSDVLSVSNENYNNVGFSIYFNLYLYFRASNCALTCFWSDWMLRKRGS